MSWSFNATRHARRKARSNNWHWDGIVRPSKPSRGYEHVPRISDELHAVLAGGNEDPPEELQREAADAIAAACAAIRAMHGHEALNWPLVECADGEPELASQQPAGERPAWEFLEEDAA